MQGRVVTGNALVDGEPCRGWFMGYFVPEATNPRSTVALEVKWTTHTAGESRSQWAKNLQATTLSILIRGRFRVQFRDRDVVLVQEGDYVLWLPQVPHYWVAEENSTILTIRWPSQPQDSIELDSLL